MTQLFVLGSAVGMVFAIARNRRTGNLDDWPLHVAYGALFFMMLGVVYLILEAII